MCGFQHLIPTVSGSGVCLILWEAFSWYGFAPLEWRVTAKQYKYKNIFFLMGMVSFRMTSPHPQGTRSHTEWLDENEYEAMCYVIIFTVTRSQSSTFVRLWIDVLDSALHHNIPRINCQNIFWKHDVYSSSTEVRRLWSALLFWELLLVWDLTNTLWYCFFLLFITSVDKWWMDFISPWGTFWIAFCKDGNCIPKGQNVSGHDVISSTFLITECEQEIKG